MKHNFSEMSSEELVALLETADEQTAAAINAELESRETAEGTTAEDPEAKLNAMLEECQKNVGHKCRVVPAGTIEYADGVIVGCVKVKRSNTVAYAIKLDNGKRMVKNYKAPLFEILDEIVDNPKVVRTSGTKQELWPAEKMNEEVAKYIGNVGRKVSVNAADGTTTEGQITGIVPVKRSNSILYRIVCAAPTEENPEATVTIHKSVTNTTAFTIHEADEESEAFNAEYRSHREKLASKPALTGHDLVLDIELKLEKAKEAVAKAEERVRALTESLEAARAKATAEEQSAEVESAEVESEDML